jgi:AmmeMemoRadiSam system protein A
VPAREPDHAGLSQEERMALLRAARGALEEGLRGRSAQASAPRGLLAEKRGAFVTLRTRADGELRGCIGSMRGERPLLETVQKMAMAAAREDGRFSPVTGEELDSIVIEISALGPMRRISPEEVEVGRHGLVIGLRGCRGVLLPQVPVEHGWDRVTFLRHLCLKAGLPEESWRLPGVELSAFTAEVFSED